MKIKRKRGTTQQSKEKIVRHSPFGQTYFSACFAGMGGAPLAVIQLGKGDKERAEKILGNAKIMLIACSIILTIVFVIFKEPILCAFGASEETLGFAVDYLTFI